MFGLFKKNKKAETEEEKLEKEIAEAKKELQDIFSYVHSHFNEKSNNISLKPQDYNVGFPKNRTVINSNLLTLNSNCHNEKQQI